MTSFVVIFIAATRHHMFSLRKIAGCCGSKKNMIVYVYLCVMLLLHIDGNCSIQCCDLLLDDDNGFMHVYL